MPLTLDSIVARTDGMMTGIVDGDLAIFNLRGDNYIGLDQAGRRVWELLAEATRVGDLCGKAALEFEGDPETIAKDILVFLDDLLTEGLLHVARK